MTLGSAGLAARATSLGRLARLRARCARATSSACRQGVFGGELIAFLEINHVAESTFAIGDPGGRIDAHACADQLLLNFGERTQLIVALNEAGVLRSGKGPPGFRRGAEQALGAIRKNGQLHSIISVRHGAERQQIYLLRRERRQKLVGAAGLVIHANIKIFEGTDTESFHDRFTSSAYIIAQADEPTAHAREAGMTLSSAGRI